jgi:hypothetical protein
MRGYLASVWIVGMVGLAVASASAASPSANAGWRTFTDEFGTRVQYPAGLFPETAGPEMNGTGRRFLTSDRRARLSIYALPSEGHSPRSYLATHFRGLRSALTYDRVSPHFFAISMRKNGMILYRRCNFSAVRERIHCIDLSYPMSEKKSWDSTVTRISRSLRSP